MKNAPKSHGYGGIVDFCLTLPAIARKKQETAGGFSAHPCYNKGIQTQEEGRVVLYASLLIALVVFLMDSAFQFVMEDIIYPH